MENISNRTRRILTAKNLVARIKTDEKFMKEHPENEEACKRRIARNKELLLRAVMNESDYVLDRIVVLGEDGDQDGE